MIKAFTIAATAFVMAVGAAPASGSLARSAGGTQTYNDATGDSANAADIASVTVSNNDAGLLTFTLTYANRPAGLTGDDVLGVSLDTDRNAQTGHPGTGADYSLLLVTYERDAALWKWQDQSNGRPTRIFIRRGVPQTTFFASLDGLRFEIHRRELGHTAAFNFRVLTSRDSTESEDLLPDANALLSYRLVLPQIRSVAPRFSATAPRSGRPFSVRGATVRLTNGQNVAPSAVTCTARLAGRTLRPTGRCAWRIRANARGKRLVVTVTVTYQGQRRTATRTFRVR